MTKLTLLDVFQEWDTGFGIFDVLTDMPWSDEDIDSDLLNLEYFGNHSGKKLCSPLVNHLLNEDKILTQESREKLANIIKIKYLYNWKHLWETNVVSYSPLSNYDIVETNSRTKSNYDKETQNNINNTNATSTMIRDTEDKTVHGKVTTDDLNTYGFNSSSEVPRNKNSSTESGTTSVEHNGSDIAVIGQDISDKKSKTSNNLEIEGYTNRKVGNIGAETNQQLLSEERELRMWNFFDTIFSDIDKVLALKIYAV